MQVAFTFAPRGWAFCNGQLMSIAQNTALFSLLGTTYGGDGQTTFALPDLRSRRPNHQGQGSGLSNYVIGQAGGTESVTLTVSNLPAHNHTATFNNMSGFNATTANAATAAPAAGSVLAKGIDVDVSPDAVPMIYAPAGSTPIVALAQFDAAGSVTTGTAGSSSPASNIPPYNTLNYCIALEGIFPSRN